jgi:hypothetical protein
MRKRRDITIIPARLQCQPADRDQHADRWFFAHLPAEAPITLRYRLGYGPAVPGGWRAVPAWHRLERHVSGRDMTRGPLSASRGSRLRGARGLARSSASSWGPLSQSVHPCHSGTRHGPRSLRHRTFGRMAPALPGRRREYQAVIVGPAPPSWALPVAVRQVRMPRGRITPPGLTRRG